MNEKFNYFATWLPNEHLFLGDVGLLKGRLFHRMASLESVDISFERAPDGPPADLEHSSGSGLAVKMSAGAAAPSGTASNAHVEIDFAEEGAFIFQAKHCVVESIRSKAQLGRKILRAMSVGRWDYDWVVIDTLIRARSGTVLVSTSRNSRIELSANVEPTQPAFRIADASAGLAVSRLSGDITRVIAQAGLTPLFRLSRIQRAWLLGTPRVGPVRSTDAADRGYADEHEPSEILEAVPFPEESNAALGGQQS